MTAELGRMVNRAMTARGWNGRQLAARIGKSPSYVSQLLNGVKKETPPPDTLAALERELGLSQERMLRALGYELGAEAAEPFPPESWRAAAMAKIADLEEHEAEIVHALEAKIIETRPARMLAMAGVD